MGIKILTDGAICMCPHGGQLQFIVTHKTADGADGEVLTLKDYGNTMIVGCGLVPPSGVPCTKVGMVQDPVGRVMKVKGDTVVTEMVISMTDKGWPITVVSPGRSAISIDFAPVGSTPRKPGQHEVARQKQVAAFGKAQAKTLGKAAEIGAPFCEECNRLESTPKPSKEEAVISARWSTGIAKYEEVVKLLGKTKGFSYGTPAKLKIFKVKEDGTEEPIRELSGAVHGNQVEVEWPVEYVEE